MLLITKLTARDMLPLCFVEGKGFRDLIRYIEPKYNSHKSNDPIGAQPHVF